MILILKENNLLIKIIKMKRNLFKKKFIKYLLINDQ